MKKVFGVAVIICFMVIGLSKTTRAEEICGTAVIECDNGNAGMGLVCGETLDELFQDVDELASVICGD